MLPTSLRKSGMNCLVTVMKRTSRDFTIFLFCNFVKHWVLHVRNKQLLSFEHGLLPFHNRNLYLSKYGKCVHYLNLSLGPLQGKHLCLKL